EGGAGVAPERGRGLALRGDAPGTQEHDHARDENRDSARLHESASDQRKSVAAQGEPAAVLHRHTRADDAVHRPVNLGGRFSKNAATPSAWSSEAIASACEDASASSALDRSVDAARFSICLSSRSARGGPAAIFSASSRVVSSSSAAGPTRSVRPRGTAPPAATP